MNLLNSVLKITDRIVSSTVQAIELSKIRRKYGSSLGLVVIYDREDSNGDLVEEWYGYFSDEHEAEQLYKTLENGREIIGNAHFAYVYKDMPLSRRIRHT